MFGRSRARLPFKAAEHPVGLIRIRSRPGQIVHHQWLAAPEIDNRVLRMHRPSVFTAHDLLPRRTATKRELWKNLLGRFSRVIVHSEHGRETLAELGIEPDRLRVIPHPVFASEPARADDGSTVLSLGVIRPYKGLGDTVEAVGRVPDARLLVVGDPRRAGRRVPRGRRAVGRVAAGICKRGRDRPGARRGDGRRLSVQAGDRPERRAAARARGRGAGRGLRRRRDRRARAAVRGGTGRRGRERGGADRGDPRAALGSRSAGTCPRGRACGHGTRSHGRLPPRRTWSCTRSCCDLPPPLFATSSRGSSTCSRRSTRT